MSNNPELTQKILSQIKQRKPLPARMFQLLSVARVILFFSCLVLGALLVSFFIWDILANWSILGFETSDGLTVLSSSLPEVLFMAMVLGFVGYWVYRQTDWPLVKNYQLLGIIIFFLLLFVGTGVFISVSSSDVLNKIYGETQTSIENNLAYRQGRQASLYKKAAEKGFIRGQILTITLQDSQKSEVTIQNPYETQRYEIPSELILNLSQGDRVEVFLNSEGQVESVQKLESGIGSDNRGLGEGKGRGR